MFKRILNYILFTITIGNFSSFGQEIKSLYPTHNTGVKKWEKLELGIQIPKDIQEKIDLFINKAKLPGGLNPFDPNEISITATFTAPDNTQQVVYGFYYMDYTRTENEWMQQKTDYSFRVRFSPSQIGNWHVEVTLDVKNQPKKEIGKTTFSCIKSDNKGEIICLNTKSNSGKYLRFSETNEMFFAKGINLVWSDLMKIVPSDYNKYTKWINQLHNAGGNYAQLSTLPFTYGVEWENLGDYSTRMHQAWELDQLLEYCNQKGIYINLLTLIHDEFMSNPNMWIHQNNHWSNNPYNKSKNGGLTNATNPDDFFTDEKCKTLFKRRLRYLLSRYGYSPNLAVVELLSEVDNAMEGYKEKNAEGSLKKAKFKLWFAEMKNFIEKDLGYANKLISVSYTQNDQSNDIEKGVFPDADVVLLHFYGRGKGTNYNNRYNEHIVPFTKNNSTKFKPIIFDEMGANVFPGLERSTDLTFHINLWATTFMGCYGTGQNWWWDNAILPNGYEVNLKGINAFLLAEDFAVKNFSSKTWLNNGTKFKNKTKYEAFYLLSEDGEKAVGWLHNTSFWWANLKNNNAEIAKFIENNNGSHIEQADNTTYRTEYDKGKATGAPQLYNEYKLTVEGLLPNTEYMIKWYDTKTGDATGKTETLKSGSNGKIKFNIPEMTIDTNPYGDFGFKVVKFSK